MRWVNWIFPFLKKQPLGEAAKNYVETFKKPEADATWQQCRWVVLDTETTGFDRNKSILSIGAIGIKEGGITIADSLEITLQNDGKSSAETIPVHGIMPGSSQRGVPAIEAAEAWINYVGDAILIAHNATYDINMLNGLCKAQLGVTMKNQFLDTADLAIRLEQYGVDPSLIKRSEYTLDKLCERYQIPITDRHTAAGDAMLTAQLFVKLMLEAERRGIRKIRDLKLKKRA